MFGKVALMSLVVAGLCFASCSGLREQTIVIAEAGSGPSGGEGHGGGPEGGSANPGGASTSFGGQPEQPGASAGSADGGTQSR